MDSHHWQHTPVNRVRNPTTARQMRVRVENLSFHLSFSSTLGISAASPPPSVPLGPRKSLLCNGQLLHKSVQVTLAPLTEVPGGFSLEG
jgi:hypothetical protein